MIRKVQLEIGELKLFQPHAVELAMEVVVRRQKSEIMPQEYYCGHVFAGKRSASRMSMFRDLL